MSLEIRYLAVSGVDSVTSTFTDAVRPGITSTQRCHGGESLYTTRQLRLPNYVGKYVACSSRRQHTYFERTSTPSPSYKVFSLRTNCSSTKVLHQISCQERACIFQDSGNIHLIHELLRPTKIKILTNPKHRRTVHQPGRKHEQMRTTN